MPNPLHPDAVHRAAHLLRNADALIIGAGAGMSADSGIPVYRGPQGHYTNPAPLTEANAETWLTDPTRAQQAARTRHLALLAATPHDGYRILNRWRQHLPHGAVVYTSNIDSMFTRAGFPTDTVYEVHGSAARSQCLRACQGRHMGVFPTPDPEHGVATCPHCGGPARPNVLMFGDYDYNTSHTATQWNHLGRWFDHLPDPARVVVLEIGAGQEVRTVRTKCETLAAAHDWPLIRINPHEPHLPARLRHTSITLPLPALDALTRLDQTHD